MEYTYDAWGNILTVAGDLIETLGKDNPLRYRGYVYDEETGLYYVSSRYYDSEIGRFINADVFASTGQGILGTNMFAYCGNNPVNRVDTSGYFWTTLAAVGIGAVASVAASAFSAMITGQEFTVGDAVGAAVEGASATIMIMVGIPPILANPMATALGSTIDEIIDFDKGSAEEGLAEILKETGRSAVSTAAFGFAGKLLPNYVGGKYLKNSPFGNALREMVYKPKYINKSAIGTAVSENFWDSAKNVAVEMLW